MALFVDTVSADVLLQDLGIVLTHPTSNFDIATQFSAEEIRNSQDLYSAILAGSLNWKRSSGGPIQTNADFDFDAVELEQERTGAGYGTPEVFTLAATTITLKASSPNSLIFSGSTTGQIVKLPEATQLNLNHRIEIFNNGSALINVQYQDNTSVVQVPPQSLMIANLEDNATANGSWFFRVISGSTTTGFVFYNLLSSTNFVTNSGTDVVITGFSITPIAGRYAVWYNANSQITTGTAVGRWSVYNNGLIISDSQRGARPGASGTDYLQTTQTDTYVDGSQAIDIRVRTSAGTMTVLGRSLFLLRIGDA